MLLIVSLATLNDLGIEATKAIYLICNFRRENFTAKTPMDFLLQAERVGDLRSTRIKF